MNNYNELREKFLNTIDKENTRRTFTLIFSKVNSYEKKIDKRIEEMNEDELKELLFTVLVGKSIESTNVKLATLRRYLKYANNLEILKLTKEDVKEAVEQFNADKENNADIRYIDKNDLYIAMNRIENDIDKTIIVLLANGVCGKCFEELQYLKVKDIDFDNGAIKLPNRAINISEGDMDIIEQGIKQDEYIKVLRMENSNPTTESYKFNMESPYAIKNRPKTTTNEGLYPYKFSGITNRIFRVIQQLCLDNITSMDILLSYAIDRLIEYGNEIGRNQLSADEMHDYVLNVLGINLCKRNIFDIYYSIVPKKPRWQ